MRDYYVIRECFAFVAFGLSPPTAKSSGAMVRRTIRLSGIEYFVDPIPRVDVWRT
jgi:hypothetical protein